MNESGATSAARNAAISASPNTPASERAAANTAAALLPPRNRGTHARTPTSGRASPPSSAPPQQIPRATRPRRAIQLRDIVQEKALRRTPITKIDITSAAASGTDIKFTPLPCGVEYIGPNAVIIVLIGTQPTPRRNRDGRLAARSSLPRTRPAISQVHTMFKGSRLA